LKTHLSVEVVDLRVVTPAELEDLWQYEAHVWRDQLLWDASAFFAALRRLVERRGLPGKAVRVDGQTVGYAYYGTAGCLGVIAGLVVSPDWSSADVGEMLLKKAVDEVREKGVSRIESQFLSIDCPWLAPAFERQGFRAYWREVLRLDIRRPRRAVSPSARVDLEPWQETHFRDAVPIMRAAYHGGVEAEIHARYHTLDGCQMVLDDILNQGSCGTLVADASALARDRGQGIGFVVVTEVAPRQGHLAQVAVLPEYQGRGIGQSLLEFCVSRLAELRFDTLSLIVSRSNDRALRTYQAIGFQSVLAFPAFVWER
jgi:ribosomal protein S18 acetylase RimI-like enzyme